MPVLAPPAEPLVIEQQDQEFRPYVTPVVVGTRISFPNRDTVQHHVYSVSKPKHFEIPLYRGESKEAVLFDHPGLATIGCNIHDWMIGDAIMALFGAPVADPEAAYGTRILVSKSTRQAARAIHPLEAGRRSSHPRAEKDRDGIRPRFHGVTNFPLLASPPSVLTLDSPKLQ
jgi:hypothetical protein